jgi:RimJ/RimL family protein N-acetyltransferase
MAAQRQNPAYRPAKEKPRNAGLFYAPARARVPKDAGAAGTLRAVDGAPELLTERLRLRTWRDDDGPAIAAINADPEVGRYLNNPLDDGSGSSFFQRVRAHWARHGSGVFAIEGRAPEPDHGRLLGFAGCAYPTFIAQLADRPELGWRLDHAVWGRGYATEAARAAREDARVRMGIDELISIIHPDNVRSRRVAQKLGMTIEGQVRHPALGIDIDVWVSRSD